ncbi:MAG: hypothetical protein K6G60_06810 [Lachnospiraceae bacterium]|nr:hypothetical protein [Lachnospiraceae bacterium]
MADLIYILKHKDKDAALIKLTDKGDMVSYEPIDLSLTPYLGTADAAKIRRWWKTRGIPLTRRSLNAFLAEHGIKSSEEYLIKNLALSMTDSYWIAPLDSNLRWSDVNLRVILKGGYAPIALHNVSSYDPNATLSGNMNKYWEISGNEAVLVKEAREYYGLQALNEQFATMINDNQAPDVPYVKYRAYKVDDGFDVKCKCFVEQDQDLVPALEIVDSKKNANDVSLYDHYIETCVQNGIAEDEITRFMDYQTALDFVISNTDEHLLNFGVKRDSETLRLVAPAPIYDNGNSMFYSENRIYSRVEMLGRRITGVYEREEKMLAHIKDRMILKESLLPSPEDVRDFYAQADMPEKKLDMIVKNYETKVQLFHDFQCGKTISLYHEKQ